MEVSDITLIIGDQVVPLPTNLILAALVIFLIIRLRRLSADDIKAWNKTRDPVPPSLKESKSAFDVMYDGTAGCLWSMAERVVIAVLFLVFLDLLFAQGAHSQDVLRVLFDVQ